MNKGGQNLYHDKTATSIIPNNNLILFYNTDTIWLYIIFAYILTIFFHGKSNWKGGWWAVVPASYFSVNIFFWHRFTKNELMAQHILQLISEKKIFCHYCWLMCMYKTTRISPTLLRDKKIIFHNKSLVFTTLPTLSRLNDFTTVWILLCVIGF